MTSNPQTEARAIAEGVIKRMTYINRKDRDVLVEAIATALAAKDADLAEAKEQLQRQFDQTVRFQGYLVEAKAQLAEARKALKLAEQMMTKDSLCEAERLEEGLSAVRRALTGGQEDG